MKLFRTFFVSSLFLVIILIAGCNEAPTTSNEMAGSNQQLSKTAMSATLHIFNYFANGQTINIYAIQSNWVECEATWNNPPLISAVSEGSFTTSAAGWLTADVTGLVNKWLSGKIENYGLLLSTTGTNLEQFDSREGINVPYISIIYSDGTEEVIDIADTELNELEPDANSCSEVFLFNGIVNGYQKYSLLKFDVQYVPEVSCETAYAKGPNAICFLDIPNKQGTNWGWTNRITGAGSWSFPVYAGAGQCDETKGALVGTLDVTYNGTTVTVLYNIDANFTLDETHLWVGTGMLPVKKGKYVSNPGGFNYNGQNPVSVNISAPFYIAAHSVVCSSNWE